VSATVRGTSDIIESARALCDVGRRCYERGWVLATSGNFSTVISRDPLRLAITASGRPKGDLTIEDVLLIDECAHLVDPQARRPSAEARLHVEIVRLRDAGAVLHTHSIWSTIISDLYAPAGGVTIKGYEMQKALEGVTTHEHAEWLPIVDNDQDMDRLAGVVGARLRDEPAAHGLLLRRHGLYTWGEDLAQAARHIEALEFLLEAIGRTRALQAGVAGVDARRT
jgi:methylthioribulose-1-phosphate dehydratase